VDKPEYLFYVLARPRWDIGPWEYQENLNISILQRPLEPNPMPSSSTFSFNAKSSSNLSSSYSISDLHLWRTTLSGHEDLLYSIHAVHESEPYGVNRLYQEWLARVRGGAGC
jgi:hypothetical protein